MAVKLRGTFCGIGRSWMILICYEEGRGENGELWEFGGLI
jgi:hypothetical protein